MPLLEIIESKKYFKNDVEGIEYSRTIDVYCIENIELKKQELKLINFESRSLDNTDYVKAKDFLKRVKKNY